MSEIAKGLEYAVVEARPKSAMEQFARWFHQDWRLMFSNPDDAALAYLENLSPSQRAELRDALSKFIEGLTGKSEREVRSAWIELGAEAIPGALPLMEQLQQFHDQM